MDKKKKTLPYFHVHEGEKHSIGVIHVHQGKEGGRKSISFGPTVNRCSLEGGGMITLLRIFMEKEGSRAVGIEA